MPRKRKPMNKPLKGEPLIPLPLARPWYHAPLTLAANGVAGLLGVFHRAKPQPIAPRAARKRRKK